LTQRIEKGNQQPLVVPWKWMIRHAATCEIIGARTKKQKVKRVTKHLHTMRSLPTSICIDWVSSIHRRIGCPVTVWAGRDSRRRRRVECMDDGAGGIGISSWERIVHASGSRRSRKQRRTRRRTLHRDRMGQDERDLGGSGTKIGGDHAKG
jgi:hypothetical protein